MKQQLLLYRWIALPTALFLISLGLLYGSATTMSSKTMSSNQKQPQQPPRSNSIELSLGTPTSSHAGSSRSAFHAVKQARTPALPGSQGVIYTEAQAARGQVVYDKQCASCHGLRLEGGSASALSGGKFADRWGRGDKSVDDLYYITRTQMPFGAGNTLSRQQYIDSVAYMLKANGYKAGTRELPADPAFLKKIKIESQGPMKEAFHTSADSEAGAPTANAAKASPDPCRKAHRSRN